MTTKQKKGDLGVCKAIADLSSQGVNVSIPISESQGYDVILEKNGLCKTAQVKYCTAKANGSLQIALRSKWSTKGKNNYKARKSGKFDILVVYCPDTDECYYFLDNEFTNSHYLWIRIREPKQMQKKVRLAKEYKSVDRAFI